MTEPGDDLLRRIARAGAEIDPGLTDRDVERLVAGARRLRRRRTAARLGLGVLATGVAAAVLTLRVGGGGGGGGAPPASQPVAEVRPAPPPGPQPRVQARPASPVEAPVGGGPVRLADGSVATPLDEGSELAVREVSPRRVSIELGRGRARFDVVPRPERSFSVTAGDVTVTVLGTVFTVERVADRIGVAVERGRVAVDWGVGMRRLVAGERGWFPPLVVGARAREPKGPRDARGRRELALVDAPPPPAPARAPAPAPAPAAQAPAPEAPLPAAAARAAAADSPEALLAAADAARVAGHAREGAALLRRVVEGHRDDPRAPLAAFTLGRVLLMELHEPRQAAAAFREARALAPAGPFAEDALAREVEAWARAGDKAQARARAEDYLGRYPRGRRAQAVRSLGGVE